MIVYSTASNLSESAKEKYVPESGRQVAPSYGAGTDYTQFQTCNLTNKCNNRLAKIADVNQKLNKTRALMADNNRDLTWKKQIIPGTKDGRHGRRAVTC